MKEFVRNISGELARIAARYIGVGLTTYGLISPEGYSAIAADVAAIIGALIIFVVEAWYTKDKITQAKGTKNVDEPVG